VSETKIAIPAELRSCFAYLSFSFCGVKNRPKSRLPNHLGRAGLPDDAVYRPSPVRTASAVLKRRQSHPQHIAPGGVEVCLSLQAMGQGRLDQVLGGTPEGDKKVMIVRIDRGTPARKIGQERNGVIGQPTTKSVAF